MGILDLKHIDLTSAIKPDSQNSKVDISQLDFGKIYRYITETKSEFEALVNHSGVFSADVKVALNHMGVKPTAEQLREIGLIIADLAGKPYDP